MGKTDRGSELTKRRKHGRFYIMQMMVGLRMFVHELDVHVWLRHDKSIAVADSTDGKCIDFYFLQC